MATTPVSAEMGSPAMPPAGRSFRFTVKVMPPRRPDHSLSQRTQSHYQPPPDQKPLSTFSVPAKTTDTFAKVWELVKMRFETGYGFAHAAQGYFHKLQDCNGADVFATDVVGDLGFGPESRPEELILTMLQNALDREGSIADSSTLRPPGFAKRPMTEEESRASKRRKVQTERFGAPLDEINEDTPITSREPSGPADFENVKRSGGQQRRRVDADGFAVPAMPRLVSTPKNCSSQIVQSSMDGEDDEDVLVQDSQGGASQEDDFIDRNQTLSLSRTRNAASVPAAGIRHVSHTNRSDKRSRTLAPRSGGQDTVHNNISAQRKSRTSISKSPESLLSSMQHDKSQAGDGESRIKSLPTPTSGKLPSMHEEPPESAQRPRPSAPSPGSTHKFKRPSPAPQLPALEDEDPIEDEDLLPDIPDEDFDEAERRSSKAVQLTPGQANAVTQPAKKARKPQSGAVRKRNGVQTPRAKNSMLPNSSLVSASGRLKSSGSARNPRASTGPKNVWSAAEDSYIIKGLQEGLTAAVMVQRFDLNERTNAAVRGRIALLKQKDPRLARQQGRDADDNHQRLDLQSSQTKSSSNWAQNEVVVLSKAIAEGFDALEIQANHFPTKSQDSVNRKVRTLQDSVWKKAQGVDSFPDDAVKLRGWTLKESCKLRRAWREQLSAKDAKLHYLSRWSLADVIKKYEAYEAQCRRLKITPTSRAAKAVFPASQDVFESSPIQRSMQSRAARSSDAEVPHESPARLPSSPPQPSVEESEPLGLQAPGSEARKKHTSITKRGSSPKVRVPLSEQDKARQTSLTRPHSSSERQPTLSFYRDKGKGRAGPVRPSDADLDAQYKRRKESDTPTTVPQVNAAEEVVTVSSDSSSSDDDEDEVDGVQTPVDNLNMLEAIIDAGGVRSEETPKELSAAVRPTTDPRVASQISEELQDSLADEPQMPVKTEAEESKAFQTQNSVPTRSQRRTRRTSSMAESAVEPSEESQDSQGFQTQDPATSRSQRKTRRTSSMVESAIKPTEDIEDSQEFQTQDPATSRSQRQARKKASPSTQPIESLQTGMADTQGSPVQVRASLRSQSTATTKVDSSETRTLRPRQSLSGHSSDPRTPGARDLAHQRAAAATQVTASASGKLPARGKSYASRIHDALNLKSSAAVRQEVEEEPVVHEPQQGSEQNFHEPSAASQTTSQSSTKLTPQVNRSPMPTDAAILAKVKSPGISKRKLQRKFEKLKQSTLSVRAMERDDWDEVTRLHEAAKQRRIESKIARGKIAMNEKLFEHPDGPATQGDLLGGDEDVIRDVGNDLTSSSDDEDESDGKDGDDTSQDEEDEDEEDMDRERHFSEVEDEEEKSASEVLPAPQPEPNMDEDVDMGRDEHAVEDEDANQAAELPTFAAVLRGSIEAESVAGDLDDSVLTPLTAKALSRLNSETEIVKHSPPHTARKSKAGVVESHAIPFTPERQRKVIDDRAAMPPPSANFKGVSSSSVANMSTDSKKAKRSKRGSKGRHESASETGSMASSSSVLRPNHGEVPSDSAAPALVSSPSLQRKSSPPFMEAKVNAQLPSWSFSPLDGSEPKITTPPVVTATTTSSMKSPKAANEAPTVVTMAATPFTAPVAAKPPASLSKSQRKKAKRTSGSQPALKGNLSAEMQALLRKAHIPSPPKPKKASPPRTGRFHRRMSDDEDDSSSSSSSE